MPCGVREALYLLLLVVFTEALHRIPPNSLNTDISSQWGHRPKDCAEVQALDFTESGVYTIYVGENNKPVQVFCDLKTTGGGWLVFQRRVDGFENFFRDWLDYSDGFGDLYGEFWLGNHVIHQLTNQKPCTMRVELLDNAKNVSKVAEYSHFEIGAPFQKYKLDTSGYSGDAGDALSHVSGTAFSTRDRDHDTWPKHCAQTFKGAWWYTNCHSSNLNGYYHGGPHTSYADGVNWADHHFSWPRVQMKIRPADFVTSRQ